MVRHSIQSIARLAGIAAIVGTAGVIALAQQPAAGASASGAKMKELVSLLKAKSLDAFAVREDPFAPRFVAVSVVPDVQALLVSADYSRPTDIEYWIYMKKYADAYRDLKTSTLGSKRFFVEDVRSDGLVAVPAKNGVPDSVMIEAAKQLFEGPADPKKRNDTRMPADAYHKAFSDADLQYAKLLDVLIAELKK